MITFSVPFVSSAFLCFCYFPDDRTKKTKAENWPAQFYFGLPAADVRTVELTRKCTSCFTATSQYEHLFVVMHHYTTDIHRFSVNIILFPENMVFMTSSHGKVSALFIVVLQLNVQNGKGVRKEASKVMWIKISEIFFF
jgi:hypothetical protein